MSSANMQSNYRKKYSICKRCGCHFVLIDNRGRVPNYCKPCKPIHNRELDQLRKQRSRKEDS